MNVFVAGASGAIGRPLVAELIRRGHAVTGMTRSDAGAKALADLGRPSPGRAGSSCSPVRGWATSPRGWR